MLEFLRIFHIRALSHIVKSYWEKKRIGLKGIMMSTALIYGHGVVFAVAVTGFIFFPPHYFHGWGGVEMVKACFQNLLK